MGISPSGALAGGGAFTLTVTGSGFDSGAMVLWNNSALPLLTESATQLTATVPASDIFTPGIDSVTVSDNGLTSNSAAFTVSANPVISSISPSSATAGGGGFTLTVSGSGFDANAVVQWTTTSGTMSLTTSFGSATQLTANVGASLIDTAGSATVTVLDGGLTSNGETFTIAAGPAITSLSPSSAIAGQAGFPLTVNGSGFVSGATVQWTNTSGTTSLTTTFGSATQLTAQVPASLVATVGSATVTVTVNGVTSSGATFTIAAGPAITSLSPSSAIAGQAGFALTVNGSGFVSGATVQWTNTSGTTSLTTTFGSATELTAQVPASLVATVGSATVTVTVNGVTSSGATFTIAAGPAITSLSPSSATAGQAGFAHDR